MPKPSASAVNHHTHLSLEINAHFTRRESIVDLVDHLNLRVVITRAQRAQLITTHSFSSSISPCAPYLR